MWADEFYIRHPQRIQARRELPHDPGKLNWTDCWALGCPQISFIQWAQIPELNMCHIPSIIHQTDYLLYEFVLHRCGDSLSSHPSRGQARHGQFNIDNPFAVQICKLAPEISELRATIQRIVVGPVKT